MRSCSSANHQGDSVAKLINADCRAAVRSTAIEDDYCLTKGSPCSPTKGQIISLAIIWNAVTKAKLYLSRFSYLLALRCSKRHVITNTIKKQPQAQPNKYMISVICCDVLLIISFAFSPVVNLSL